MVVKSNPCKWLALGSCLLVALTRPVPAYAQNGFAGEYGLYVWEKRDSVIVQWLTDESAPGFLRATAQGKVIHQRQTPPAHAHRVAWRTKDAVITLEYGSGSLRSVTVIDRKPQRRAARRAAADSIFVLGDTHGEYDSVIKLLTLGGLIGKDLKWSGGRKQIVFLGDVMDRGPNVTKLLWLLYRLEREAHAHGGGVHLLLGNHEIMVMLGDLRYVHPKEQQLARMHDTGYARLFDPRASILGRWLTTKPAIIQIDDLLFAHGGVSSDYAGYSAQSHADSLKAQIGRELFYAYADTTASLRVDSLTFTRFDQFFMSSRSVFWYRGYVDSDTTGTELDQVLQAYGAAVHLVGHTAQPEIREKFGGKLIAVHPRTPAAEMLLLVRSGHRYLPHRVLLSGAIQRLSSP